jgi:hypothetical protein
MIIQLTGKVVEIGNLDFDPGMIIEIGLGKFVKITGLTRETLARIPGNILYRDVNLSISTLGEQEEAK